MLPSLDEDLMGTPAIKQLSDYLVLSFIFLICYIDLKLEVDALSNNFCMVYCELNDDVVYKAVLLIW